MPTAELANERLVGVTVTDALPVPVKLTVCGVLAAASLNVRVPVAAPIVVGAKTTPTKQVAPAAMLPVQELLTTLNPVEVTMLVKLSEIFS